MGWSDMRRFYSTILRRLCTDQEANVRYWIPTWILIKNLQGKHSGISSRVLKSEFFLESRLDFLQRFIQQFRKGFPQMFLKRFLLKLLQRFVSDLSKDFLDFFFNSFLSFLKNFFSYFSKHSKLPSQFDGIYLKILT